MPHTLYLVDANIYLYRAWKLSVRKGRQEAHVYTQACAWLRETLAALLQKASGQMCAFVFDGEGHRRARQAILPAYKAQRPAAPEALSHLRQQAARQLERRGLAVYRQAEREADDVIADLAQWGRAQACQVVVISADKDLMQVLQPGDLWWDFLRQSPLGWREVTQRMGVTPLQIADLLALAGDPADNIRGVQGVGLSTAAKLLRKWGTLENLYANLGEVASMKFRGSALVARALYEDKALVLQNRQITGMLPVMRPDVDRQRLQISAG